MTYQTSIPTLSFAGNEFLKSYHTAGNFRGILVSQILRYAQLWFNTLFLIDLRNFTNPSKISSYRSRSILHSLFLEQHRDQRRTHVASHEHHFPSRAAAALESTPDDLPVCGYWLLGLSSGAQRMSANQRPIYEGDSILLSCLDGDAKGYVYALPPW